MDTERARKVEALYESALKLKGGRRAAFLAGNCGGDESLRLEVESLLEHDEDTGPFLAVPALEMLAEKARLASGERVSHYEIQEKLGEGGMGVVYQARDARLGRRVALKFVKAQFSERWEREARAIAALNHPHIATLYDVGQHEGAPYLVMEYVAGRTLDKLIPRHGMRLNEALKIAIQVAGALTCAHSAGIVHRDLKPSNLMGDETGQVKVLDFGLAKLVEKGRQPEIPVSETGEGTIAGTPAYMSPEQAEGKPVDARSDIFSFGSLLYEMVTGRQAFRGDSKASMMAAVLNREPEPISSELPAELGKIIAKCLRKDPDRRFQHIDDVKGALEDLLDEVQAGKRMPAAVTPKAWRPGLSAIVAVIVLAVSLLAFNVGGMRDRLFTRKPPPVLDPKRAAVAIFENRTGDPSLDNLGKMAAESVNQGLLQIPTITVVPSSTVFELPASVMRPGKLAQATGAGTVVTGATYLQGQTLQVQATIMDEVENKPLYAIEPADGTRQNAVAVVESVRQRVLDVVAARYLTPGFDLLAEEVKPPPFEAQKEFAAGWELLGSDPFATAPHLQRALEIDAEFAAPGFLMGTALRNQHKYREVTAQLDSMEKTHPRLTPIMRRRLDGLRALNDGRLEELYIIWRDIVTLSRGNADDLMKAGRAACWVNRPREAVERFRAGRSTAFLRTSNAFGVNDLMHWTGALHVLGEHEEELKEARWGRDLYPHVLNVRALEARALVALGRIDEVEKLVEEIPASSSEWVYARCCVANGTPGYVMLSAAEELRTHGHREESLKMAGRAADWYHSRIGEDARSEDTRSGLGIALYEAERWGEARALFSALAAEHPDSIPYKGRLGTLAARQGDRPTAQRIAQELRGLERPYSYGNQLTRGARILALVGDKEGAVALLREALARGLGLDSDLTRIYGYGLAFSHNMDLESLHGYPPFEELIKPKD